MKEVKEKPTYYLWTFNCRLVNKGLEEDFEYTTKDTALILAKDTLDEFLQHNWGWITKRVYKNENMHSERYWAVDLIKVVPCHKP